jgi:diguanylate cyclase (GGDEF)-like protein
MRRGAALLLAALLALPAAAMRPGSDGSDPVLQAEMDRLLDLRTQDAAAFQTGVEALLQQAPPTTRVQREQLQVLVAIRHALRGRPDAAVETLLPVAERSEDERLRLVAGHMVVNHQANLRQFEEALRRLQLLLKAYPEADGPLHEDILALWVTASITYSEMGHAGLTRHYAGRVLAAGPTARQACIASLQIGEAAELEAAPDAPAPDFAALRARCEAAGELPVFGLWIDLLQAGHLRRSGRLAEAQRLTHACIETGCGGTVPLISALLHAHDATYLLALGRHAAAAARAEAALSLARETPTSLPVAMAEKVLYEIHRQRGDNSAALRHLQQHIAANRALAEESLTKERALRTVQHESLQREQELAITTERNRVLDLEARLAKAESRHALIVALVLLLTVAGLVLWARRLWMDATRFRALAQTDPLTGFATRQHFTELAAAALDRGRAEARPLMLVAFDLDHFKHINDRHGHLAGDAVLRAVSDAARAVPAPAPCTLGRIGGEEFAVLLDGATADQAAAYAEALRGGIAAAKARIDNGLVLAVTASFGLTGTHEAGHDLQSLLDRADRALYRAKNSGRDRVVLAEHVHALKAA